MGYLGASLGTLKPLWGSFELIRGNLGGVFGHFRLVSAILGHFQLLWGILGLLGAIWAGLVELGTSVWF